MGSERQEAREAEEAWEMRGSSHSYAIEGGVGSSHCAGIRPKWLSTGYWGQGIGYYMGLHRQLLLRWVPCCAVAKSLRHLASATQHPGPGLPSIHKSYNGFCSRIRSVHESLEGDEQR